MLGTVLGLSGRASEGMFKDMHLNQGYNNQVPTMRIKGTIKEETDQWLSCGCYATKPIYVDLEVTLHNMPNNSCPNLSPEAIVSIVRAIQNSKEGSNE